MKLKKKWIRLSRSNRLYQLDIPILGLTGGVASGKSTFSKWLKSDGFPVIDADLIIKSIYAQQKTYHFFLGNHSSYIDQLIQKIDLKKLRKDFFADTKLQTSVNQFLFTYFQEEFLKQAQPFFSKGFLIYDAPLIFEKNLHHQIDQVITIYCSEANQIQRLTSRDNIDRNLAMEMIKQQLPNQIKIDGSAYSIANDGDLAELNLSYLKFKSEFFES